MIVCDDQSIRNIINNNSIINKFSKEFQSSKSFSVSFLKQRKNYSNVNSH